MDQKSIALDLTRKRVKAVTIQDDLGTTLGTEAVSYLLMAFHGTLDVNSDYIRMMMTLKNIRMDYSYHNRHRLRVMIVTMTIAHTFPG
jgi:hypothetical protein